MDMRATGGEEDSVDGSGAEGIDPAAMTYHKQTGDGKWFTESLAMLRQSIKEAQAESTAKPEKSMRSVDGADLSGLRPENCRR